MARAPSKTSAPKVEALDLPKLRKALEKGHRSVLLTIKNETTETLTRKTAGDASVNGKWVQDPLPSIPAKGTMVCGAVGKGVLNGTDGQLVFSVPGFEGDVIFRWNNGKDKEKRGWSFEVTEDLKDSSYHIYQEGSGDKHQEISWSFLNIMQQQQEAEAAASNEKALPTPAGALSKPEQAVAPSSSIDGDSASDSDDEPAEKKINVVIRDKPAAEEVGGEELKNLAKAIFAKPAARPTPSRYERRDSRVTGTAGRPAGLTREDSWVLPKQVNVAKARPEDLHKCALLSVISPPGTRHSPLTNRQAKDSFRSALVSLDLGNFEDGLTKVNQAISYLIAMPEPQAKRKEVRSAVYYKVAFSLLAEVKKRGDFQISAALELLTFLTLLPLRHDHRLTNMRRLVTENMKAGNYGIAQRYLQVLVPLKLKDSDALAAKLKECEERGKGTKDAAIVAEKDKAGRYQRFCYKVRPAILRYAVPSVSPHAHLTAAHRAGSPSTATTLRAASAPRRTRRAALATSASSASLAPRRVPCNTTPVTAVMNSFT